MASVIATTGAWTVLFSVILHGVKADPLRRTYGTHAERFPASTLERTDKPEPQIRPRHPTGPPVPPAS
jgi:hypothetical protein